MIIKIKGLKAEAIIGVYDWEKTQRRPLIIDVELEIDGKKAIESDNVADTVDYDLISKKVIAETAASNFNLIEKLAAHLAGKVLEDAKINRVKIKINKPGVVPIADSVSVTHERKKQ